MAHKRVKSTIPSRTGSEPDFESTTGYLISPNANSTTPVRPTDKKICDNGITLEYKQSGNGNNSNKKIITTRIVVDTLGGLGDREIRAQSLVFAASRSSFFLCQFAAPILNLQRGDRRRRASISHGRTETAGQATDSPLDVIKVRKLLLEFLQLALHEPVIRVRLLRSTSTSRLLYNQKKKGGANKSRFACPSISEEKTQGGGKNRLSRTLLDHP